MICRYCFNKTKDEDYYCRVCGHRTNKMPKAGETLLTPLIETYKEEPKEKNPYKKFYIYASIVLSLFLIIIIYLIILIIKNKI